MECPKQEKQGGFSLALSDHVILSKMAQPTRPGELALIFQEIRNLSILFKFYIF